MTRPSSSVDVPVGRGRIALKCGFLPRAFLSFAIRVPFPEMSVPTSFQRSWCSKLAEHAPAMPVHRPGAVPTDVDAAESTHQRLFVSGNAGRKLVIGKRSYLERPETEGD